MKLTISEKENLKINEIVCRICLSGIEEDKFIELNCLCKGTVKIMHNSCFNL